MKKNQLFKSVSSFVTLLILSLFTFAQDKKVDLNITTEKTTSNWYAEPWVWIVGGAVFILLLVALMKNNSKSSS